MFHKMVYFLIFLCLLLLEIGYFKIADHFNIVDKPNDRSSHTYITIRGGGIIFLIAIVIAAFMHVGYTVPAVGAALIGIVSFLDDRITLSNRLRILFHLISVTLLLYFLGVFDTTEWYLILGLYILVIGIINAYNFMDGVNGMTGLYSLVILGSLQYVNLNVFTAPFVHPDMIWLPMIACAVFLLFNFRKRAKCFAGDVGSVTMAFWILFLLLSLILRSDDWSYLFFLSVYGVDSVLTIVHRLLRKENIFKAHRLHFYQILANERGVSHLWIATLYAVLQLSIILLLIVPGTISSWVLGLAACTVLALVYCFLKPYLMKKH